MNVLDIVAKKNNKEELSYEEIKYTVDNYISGDINDEDMTLFLKAVKKNEMSFKEIYDLTNIMLNSGEILDLSNINGTIVDKHSSGGVGDKTSLVVLPIVASCNVKIAKMSGRSLGFTGGTIDKLESIPGFKTSINTDRFIKQVNDINIALVSQSGNLVPADKKIYALRDVTDTTDSISLISSSIMSKKLASGSNKIVLDVKVGNGAFIKDINRAKELTKIMVQIGNNYGKETIGILTNMNYPLGYTIGNSLEVLEAIDVLDNKGESNFTKLCLALSSYMVSLGKNISIKEALKEVETNFYNKNALNKFYEFIKAQDGDINEIKICPNKIEIYSDREGYITNIDALKLANLCNGLGAGRKNKDDIINHEVGIKLNKTINEYVKKDELLLTVYTLDNININDYLKAFEMTSNKLEDYKIIYEIIK